MSRRRNPLYDRIAELEVGTVTDLVQGTDFDGDIDFKRANLHTAMRYRGVSIGTVIVGQKIIVTIKDKEYRP